MSDIIFKFKYYIKTYINKKYFQYRLRKKDNKSMYYIYINKFIKVYLYYLLFLGYDKDKLNFYTIDITNNVYLNFILLNILGINNKILYNNIKLFNIFNNKVLTISMNFLKIYMYYNYVNLL